MDFHAQADITAGSDRYDSLLPILGSESRCGIIHSLHIEAVFIIKILSFTEHKIDLIREDADLGGIGG